MYIVWKHLWEPSAHVESLKRENWLLSKFNTHYTYFQQILTNTHTQTLHIIGLGEIFNVTIFTQDGWIPMKNWILKSVCFLAFFYLRTPYFAKSDFYVLAFSPQQGCINRGTCSHAELTLDHVLTSAYVIIFWTVARNAVNKSVWRKKTVLDFPSTNMQWISLFKHQQM